jgi:hypothetical protein
MSYAMSGRFLHFWRLRSTISHNSSSREYSLKHTEVMNTRYNITPYLSYKLTVYIIQISSARRFTNDLSEKSTLVPDAQDFI